MLIVLSPAKRLDFRTPAQAGHTQPRYLAQARELVSLLKEKSLAEIASLMSISDPLAALNVARYARWQLPFTDRNAKQAILAFDGDVYDGLDARSLDDRALEWAQQHLRILSGLYGVLRPLDLIQPYRLGMGTRLANRRGCNLYSFWGERLARDIDATVQSQRMRVLVHLASSEYFKVLAPFLHARIVQPVFEQACAGGWKAMAFAAKRARGRMARFAIDHRIEDPEALKEFGADGYRYEPRASGQARWVFRRSDARHQTMVGSASSSTP